MIKTATEITRLANIMSELPLPKAANMYRDCLSQYGIITTVRIVRLAEIYKRTKCGEVERDEAVRLQADILNEEVTA